MAKKLDAERIENQRRQYEKNDRKEEEKQYIRETIEKNRRGERKGRVIMPARKEYAYQDAPKIRVAAYCRVSTAEEAQVGSFEMQVQHFQSVIDSNPRYELVRIYADATVIIGLKQNPTYGRRFSPIFLLYLAFCGAKRRMSL